MKSPMLGTLIRCEAANERRIAFYQSIGLNAVQLAGVYEPWLAPSAEAEKASDELFDLLQKHQIVVPALFLSYPGQDWTRPRESVGLVPEKTRCERMLLSCRQMSWGGRYQIKYVTCHVGFLPEKGGRAYDDFAAEMKQLAKFAAANHQTFLFETGTETVAGLKTFMDDVDEPNLGINFDPANLLIYGNDDPAVLLDRMADRVKIVHCKDADRALPGETQGRETVLGRGSTQFTELLKRLLDGGFCGPLIIERELPPGPEQEKDVADAVKLIRSVIG